MKTIQCYVQFMRKKSMFTLGTFILLICTIGFWYGFPLLGLSDYFFKSHIPKFIQFLSICISIGFCFSIFLIPLHVSFAKEYAIHKHQNMLKIFFITQCSVIIIVAILFSVFYLLMSFILI